MIIKNFLPQHYCEIGYIDDISKILLENLDDSNSLYLIHPDLNNTVGSELEYLLINDDKFKIGIHVGNEKFYNPKFYHNLDIIFRFYLSDNCDYKKIYPISSGYNSSGEKGVKLNPTKPLSKRKYDVSFFGRKSSRPDFVNSINQIKNLYNIKLTDGFRQGVPIQEYYTILSESKICLAPSGDSVETFRYTESFGFGCIVITDNTKDVWYYNDTPAIVVSDWSIVTQEFLNNILNSNIDSMYEKNIEYYQNYLSPEANASYILNTIKLKK